MASSLHDVVELVSNNMAFVAIVADGHSVVTWGNAECGFDQRPVAQSLEAGAKGGSVAMGLKG